MVIKLKIFDKVLSFNNDIKNYYQLACSFQNEFYVVADSVIENLKKNNTALVFELAYKEIKKFTNDLAYSLTKFGVVNTDISNFTVEDENYLEFSNTVKNFINNMKSVEEIENTDERNSMYDNILASIHKIGLSLLSENTIKYTLDNVIKQMDVQNQKDAALSDYSYVVINNDYDNDNDEYKTTVVEKIIEDYEKNHIVQLMFTLNNTFYKLFNMYMRELEKCNCIDLSCVKDIDYAQSNKVVNSMANAKDKKISIIKALTLCPFNINVVYAAYKNYLYKNKIAVREVFADFISTFDFEEKLKYLLTPYDTYKQRLLLELNKNDLKNVLVDSTLMCDLFPDSFYGYLGKFMCKTEKLTLVTDNIDELVQLFAELKSKAVTSEELHMQEKCYEYIENLKILYNLNKDASQIQISGKSNVAQNLYLVFYLLLTLVFVFLAVIDLISILVLHFQVMYLILMAIGIVFTGLFGRFTIVTAKNILLRRRNDKLFKQQLDEIEELTKKIKETK